MKHKEKEMDRSNVAHLFSQYVDSLPKTEATMLVSCPKCYKQHREYQTTFNGLSAWSFKQETVVARDINNRLVTKLVWFGHALELCPKCKQELASKT
jgi:hypothetical protein